jgi:hypothetical protein
MPSKDLIELEPAKLMIRKVESQYRIRLPKEAEKHVSWLKSSDGFSMTCVARIGPDRQVQLFPKEPEESSLKKLSSSLLSLPASIDESSSPWIAFARYSATVWPVRVSFETQPNRFTFVLPKEARALGVAPDENENVAVFCTGEILEIWKIAEWVKHVADISSNRSHFANIALSALEERNSGTT